MLAAFLGGAAGAYSNVALENYRQRLKEIEDKNAEARELRMSEAKLRQAEESERRRRPGTLVGNPQLSVADGGYVGLRYDEQGNLKADKLADAPQGLLAQAKQEQERQLASEQLKEKALLAQIEQRTTAADKNRRWVPSGGGGASRNADGLTPYQERQLERAEAEDLRKAEDRALEDAGYFKEKGRWMVDQPVGTRGRTQPAPAKPEDISRIRAEARAALTGELGGSQSTPLPVKPGDPEPPKGTWIQLPDGRVVQHR